MYTLELQTRSRPLNLHTTMYVCEKDHTHLIIVSECFCFFKYEQSITLATLYLYQVNDNGCVSWDKVVSCAIIEEVVTL